MLPYIMLIVTRSLTLFCCKVSLVTSDVRISFFCLQTHLFNIYLCTRCYWSSCNTSGCKPNRRQNGWSSNYSDSTYSCSGCYLHSHTTKFLQKCIWNERWKIYNILPLSTQINGNIYVVHRLYINVFPTIDSLLFLIVLLIHMFRTQLHVL